MRNGLKIDSDWHAAIDSAVYDLVRTEHLRNSTIVNLPMIFPSGSTVSVEVSLEGGKCFVSDMGNGYLEADLMGSKNYYPRIAKYLAEENGIIYDGETFFASDASIDCIAGLITIVANCSHQASMEAAYKLSRKREKGAEDELYRRLTKVFGPKSVDRGGELKGASNHSWHIASIVHVNDRLAVFEPVLEHHNSIVNVATKMHDLARLENPPARITVTRKISKLGDMVGVLSQASNLIEISTSDKIYRKYADAA